VLLIGHSGHPEVVGTMGQLPAGAVILVEDVAQACLYLAKQRFGAIIVLERRIGLRGLIQGGTTIDGEVSTRLLQTIFFPGSALHDLAVIVRGKRVVAAGVQLPLADPGELPDPMLGSRHRAAVGLAKETDALVIVVSEESGAIRLAERGRLSRSYDDEAELAAEIRRRLRVPSEQKRETDEPNPITDDSVDEETPDGKDSGRRGKGAAE